MIGIGQLISILTSTIVGFSIIFWISNEFKSPTALSLAILAGFLPQFVLGLFAGVYVDRWNRKKTMFYSDLFIAFCTLCLFIVITKGYKDLSFLSIDCLSFNRQYVSCTCFTGKHPLLVPKHHLVRVSGLYHSIQSFSEVIAPAVGQASLFGFPYSIFCS
ncbi:MFS transporter [Bacteroides sp. CR5/BHMF/2]|nr:MFS transporter [Bacteroides sp. CR5/BHMF/2]